MTLVRAAMCRLVSPSILVVRSGADQIRASSSSISAIEWARAVQRRTGSPIRSGVSVTLAGR
jgi:hypothetical protein